MPANYHIYPLGDHALTIDLGDTITPEINQECLEIASLLAQEKIVGIKDIIPAYCTVSVIYDPAIIFQLSNVVSPFQFIRQKTTEVLNGFRPSGILSTRKIEIPACFDSGFAPDLSTISQEKKIGEQEIISLFLGETYRVYMIGFVPGFAYMAKVPDAIATPRKERPNQRVEPGSIGIAGSQTGIYPLNSPGGWNIIGRTPLRLFDPSSNEPCLLRAGDEITFRQVGLEEFHHLNQSW